MQVSWVRKGDGHLLAVGDDTFINDGRFQAQRIASSDTWTLQIRSVQLSDAGDYECQVSSNEPKISRIVHLRAVGKLKLFTSSLLLLLCETRGWTSPGNFQSGAYYLPLLFFRNYCHNESFSMIYAEPVVNIKGAPDMYVKNGSPVTLHCQISSFLISPSHVEWRLNGSLLAQVKYHHQYNQKGKNSDII